MEAINLIVQVFNFIISMLNDFAAYVFSNWVLSLFFAGSLILFVVNLVIMSSSDDSDK